MNTFTKFFTNLTAIVLGAFIGATILFGWDQLVQSLGGIKSFGGVLLLLLSGAVLAATLGWLMLHNYSQGGQIIWGRFLRDFVVAGAICVVLTALGWRWADLPTGAGIKVVGAMLVAATVSGVVTFVGRIDER